MSSRPHATADELTDDVRAAIGSISRQAVYDTLGVLVDKFESVARPIWLLIRNLSAKNTNLRTTRDLLLPKLISGELDVSTLPDPEAVAA